MSPNQAGSSKAFVRDLIGAFTLTLITITTLVILLHLGGLSLARKSLADTPSLSLASEQSVLYERIRTLCMDLFRDPEASLAVGVDRALSERILQFQENQQLLENGNPEAGLPPIEDPNLIRALARMGPVVERVASSAERLLLSDLNLGAGESDERERSRWLHTVLEAETELEHAQDRLFSAHVQRAKAALGALERRQWVLTLLALAALGALALLFYRPVVGTILRHVEERVAVQRQVEKTRRLESLEHFARGIAHDFNNLLVGILGNSDVLARRIEPESPHQEQLRQLGISAKRGAQLTHELLAFLGQVWTTPRELDLNQEIEAAVQDLQGNSARNPEHSKTEIDRRLAPDLFSVSADPGRLREVLVHLITNALESIAESGQGGRVQIVTRPVNLLAEDLDPESWELVPAAGEYAQLEVCDDGPGLAAESEGRAFDPFYSTKFTGRGLGLASVLGILRSHGGGIRVTSNGSTGAAFSMYIPRHVGTPDRDWIPRPAVAPKHLPVLPKAPARPRAQIVPEGTPLALVVDDEECVREVVARMLQGAGYTPILCDTGAEALDILREHPHEISVAFLDLVMSGMSGVQTFRGLRVLAPELPVVVSSGYPERAKDTDILGNPGVAFLRKPFLRNDLVDALANLGLEVHSTAPE